MRWILRAILILTSGIAMFPGRIPKAVPPGDTPNVELPSSKPSTIASRDTATQPSEAAIAMVSPAAADMALQTAIRDVVDANYRLTYKLLDPSLLPAVDRDELVNQRDAAAAALARQLPTTFGREGVLSLFEPRRPLNRWQEIRQSFSKPDEWLLQATTELSVPAATGKNQIVQVVFGQIESRARMTFTIWGKPVSVDVLRLKAGGTFKAWNSLSPSPPTAESLDPETVVVHVDRLDEALARRGEIQEHLDQIDFNQQEADIRAAFGNPIRAMHGIARVLTERLSQSHRLSRDDLERLELFDEIAAARALDDPQMQESLKDSGTKAAERRRILNDRAHLCMMADGEWPLAGLHGILINECNAMMADGRGPRGPATGLGELTLLSLTRELTADPAVLKAISAMPPRKGVPPKFTTMFETMLLSWKVSPERLRQIARDLQAPEYARAILIAVDNGVKTATTSTVGQGNLAINSTSAIAAHDDTSQLLTGVLYFDQRQNKSADTVFKALAAKTNDHSIEATCFGWMSQLRSRAGDSAGELADLQKATDADPANEDVLYLYGKRLQVLGDSSRAAQVFDQYLENDSITQRAAEVRQRLSAMSQSTTAPASQP